MKDAMEKKPTNHVVKGLIISLILILFSTVVFLSGQQNVSWTKWVSNILLIVGIIISCITFSNERNHDVTFGNTFAHGFKVTAVVTCISIIFTIVFLLVMPQIKQQALEEARKNMENQGKLSDSDIDIWIQRISNFFYYIAIGTIIFVYLFFGAIASLVGAAIAKKNPQGPFAQQQM